MPRSSGSLPPAGATRPESPVRRVEIEGRWVEITAEPFDQIGGRIPRSVTFNS
jgi:hypothetical protein